MHCHRNDTGEHEVARLRKLLADSTATVPLAWKLSTTEEGIFRAMLAHDVVSHGLIAEVAGPMTQQSARTHLHRIRTKLKPRGLEIETLHGRGWRLIGREQWRAVLAANSTEGVN